MGKQRVEERMQPMQPMQPIEFVGDVIRFRGNKLVRFLLDEASAGRKCDLNRLSLEADRQEWSVDDCEQFWQLIGYSVSGYGDLSFVRRKTINKADKIADKLSRARDAAEASAQKRRHTGARDLNLDE